MTDVIDLLMESAAGSFLQVGVFVGAMLLFFGYVNYRTAGGLIATIDRLKRFQVPMGAVLGVSPGCGGAIFIMPLYIRGTVTFGTVVATLIATMGDSSFVIISRLPQHALYVHLISFVVGIISGYVVDALGIGKSLVRPRQATASRPAPSGEDRYPHLGHESGDDIAKALHPEGWELPHTVGYQLTHRGYVLYWIIVGLGFALGVRLLLQKDVTQWLDLDLNRLVGLLGVGLSIVWLFAGRHAIGDDTHAELEEKVASVKEMFVHNAHETAFVTVWVFVALSAYSLFMHFSQVDLAAVINQTGVLVVVAAACIGLIPGCGPQIVLVTLYTEGIIPFSALVAQTLSQDGDALFPLIAMHPRAALLATICTTVPALVVGVLLYYLGL